MIDSCYGTTFSGDRLLAGYSDHHYFEFLHNNRFGMCLFLDGVLQSTEADQHIYHQKLVRAALDEQHALSSILVIGGAGGGVVHQLRRHPGAGSSRITVVDVDEKLFEVGRRMMPSWNRGELASGTVDVIFDNGRDYLARAKESFDVIIVDVGDPLPATRSSDIYAPAVFADIGRVLRLDGVVAFHSAVEHTCDHVFVAEALQGNGVLRKISHFPTDIPSFERPWMFNALKKRSL